MTAEPQPEPLLLEVGLQFGPGLAPFLTEVVGGPLGDCSSGARLLLVLLSRSDRLALSESATMRGLLRAYLNLTHALGGSQRFWRRLAALFLVVMGVHAAADHIDDLVFGLVDTLDLWADQAAWSFCDWVAKMGGMAPKEAVHKAQAFAEWIDMSEKDSFALVLALVAEIGIDVLLLDWIWGTRKAANADEAPMSVVAEFKESVNELKAALWPLDLQRVAVPIVLLLFSLAGAFSAALAIEGVVSSLISEVAPLWRWGINAAAAVAVASVALLAWRFIPDLIHGGILHVHTRQAQRDEKARKRAEKRADDDNVENATVSKVKRVVKRASRGLFAFGILLPLAAFGLVSQNAFVELVARAGANL